MTLLGLALGLSVTYWALVRLRLADLDEDNRFLSEMIAEATLTAPTYDVPPAAESYLVRSNGVSAAQVYEQGQLIWQGRVLGAPQPLDAQGLREGRGARTVGLWRVYTLAQGELTVQVGRRLTALQATLQPYTRVALPLTLALTLLSGLLAWLAVGVALRPLERLTQATRNFTEETELPLIPGRDEAATLTRSFSSLLTRLKAERERERRFLAHAAHELRTPISALRASLEAVRMQNAWPGMERRASGEWLERFYHEALRLETLAQNLLALSRAEASEVRPEPLDLADLVGAAYDRFQPLALERGYELVLGAESAPVWADVRLLERALDNLLANALRYAPQGEVALSSGVTEGRAHVSVADGGLDVPNPVDEGLGLRVARTVAHAHGGGLEFIQSPEARGEGLCVRLWLPLRDESPS